MKFDVSLSIERERGREGEIKYAERKQKNLNKFPPQIKTPSKSKIKKNVSILEAKDKLMHLDKIMR